MDPEGSRELWIHLKTTKGKNLVQNFIQPDYRKLFGHVLHAALDGKETANFEVSEAKHGETFTVLLNADTRRDAEAALTGAMGGGQDIAELNQVLAESKRVVVKRMRAAASARRTFMTWRCGRIYLGVQFMIQKFFNR